MTISDRIEMQRKRQGVSLTHLNNVIGAYRGKLTEVKNGKASLSDEEIRAISQALSTSTDYLLGNTDDPTPAGQKESSPQSGKPPTIEDWGKALEGKSKEELKEIMDIVMKKFMESE